MRGENPSVGIILPPMFDDPVSIGVRAEELGYDSAWMGELWETSPIVTLGELASRTDEIEIGTAILNVYSRTPAVLSMEAAVLNECSGGRFTLGLGTSTKKVIEDLHGMAFDNPPRRAHEVIELTNQYLDSGGDVEYSGQLFEVADFPALDADVEVYHAALGKANRRVVARVADGWLPHNIPFTEMPSAFDYIAEYAERSGRDPTNITVAPYIPSAVSSDPEEARLAIRKHIAYYAGSGEGYNRAIASQFPDEAATIGDLWHAGDRDDATAAVTDDMVSALGVAGTPQEARGQMRDILRMDVVDCPLLAIPNNIDPTQGRKTMDELSPKRL